MVARLTAQEKKWQAEDDARILAQAEQIKASKARMSTAKTAAKRMAMQKQKEATAMKKVASKPKRKTTRKKTNRR